MTKGGSRYEYGAGYAQRGGYGLSHHRHENMIPSQYLDRFEVLEPWQGGSNVRLPGIRALDKLLRQDNRPPTSGGDAAGRVPENQNTHRIETQSKNSRIHADALGNRPMQKFRCAPRQDSSRYASSETKTHEQPNSDYICIERESLALHSSHLNITRESGNIDTRAERDTQGNRPRFWNRDEESKLIGYVSDGYDWTEIASRMGRTEDSVKGHWYYGNLRSDPRRQGVSYIPLRRSGAPIEAGPRQ